ncbi:DUF1236 domain-containing protein [Beijerinckia mobilis]|uniref:DUF1236 domain-containing protein n=1 Tax=Beijerinckia mobilis TaxID=231434 RepID=UPI00068EB315|nr:DUF1236 domain-containing protein [Beijerinckia mobilis]
MDRKFGYLILAAMLSVPAVVHAQGVIGGATTGAEQGAAQGSAIGGPVGGIVGGAVGTATGAVKGVLGIDQTARFREQVLREHRSSYQYNKPVAVGTVLPKQGVTYYRVPSGYGIAKKYRYTIINGHTAIVDPATRTIVQIID